MLKIEQLKYQNILKGISFSLDAGDICGVFGPSGGGKSTLFRIIKNFQHYWTGVVNYEGRPINQYDRAIGYVLQESVFFSSMSVLDNLLLTGAEKQDITNLLDEMSLTHLLSKNVNNLSGGQKQRLSIARCLLMKPKLILMDEPTSALDPENANLVLNVVSKYIRDSQGIALIISHNIYNLEIYNKVMYLKDGVLQYLGSDKTYITNLS